MNFIARNGTGPKASNEVFVVGLRGIGVLLPPTYLDGLVERHPNLFERLARWEARMADTRLAGLFNDHYLIELRRSEMEYQLTN